MEILSGLLRGESSEDMFIENLMTSERENGVRAGNAQIVSARFWTFAKIAPEIALRASA